jgi:hypothetical protein
MGQRSKKHMPKTFLNISLCIDSEEPLDEIVRQVKQDIEYFYEDRQGVVSHITWDRDMALQFLQARNDNGLSIEVLTPQRYAFPADVTAVLALYNWTLPKQKKGVPEWRVVDVLGEVNGLPNLRGKVVLTNGIMAYLVLGNIHNNGQTKWAWIHWDSFVPDNPDDVPEGTPKPERKKRQEFKMKSLDGFEI